MQIRMLLLMTLLVMSLAACTGDNDDDQAVSDPTATDVAATPTVVAEEPEPTATEEIEPSPTIEPTEAIDPTVEPTTEPTEPTVEPTAGADSSLPDTPAGMQLAWIIDVLNSPDPLTEEEYTERFTEEFIAAVPFIQIVAGIAQVGPEHSPLTFDDFIEPPNDLQIVARLSGSTDEGVLVAVMVAPEEPHQIDFLQVVPESALDTTPTEFGSWDELDDQLAMLAPQASFQVSEIGDDNALQTIHAVNPDEQLGVGSAIKLYILGELARQVEAGTVSWDDELEIRDEWKSLPTGVLQDEPAGTPFTLRHYAEQMISISDNTATDHLLFHLGRENVEAFQAEMGHSEPELNQPLLSTREWFVMKLVYDDEQRQRYIDASVEEKREILDNEISQMDVTIDDAMEWTGPVAIDTIEWFASSNDLTAAMASLQEISQREGLEPVADILSINPGMQFDPVVWTYAGFKGGSEPGVLTFNWLLERQDGRWFVMTVTVNDDTSLIEETAVLRLIGGAALLLEQQP